MAQKEKAAITAAPNETKHYKDNNNSTEKQAVYRSLLEIPKTRWQVAKETGIEINSICYLVGMLINENKCKVHHIGICPIKGSNKRLPMQ